MMYRISRCSTYFATDGVDLDEGHAFLCKRLRAWCELQGHIVGAGWTGEKVNGYRVYIVCDLLATLRGSYCVKTLRLILICPPCCFAFKSMDEDRSSTGTGDMSDPTQVELSLRPGLR